MASFMEVLQTCHRSQNSSTSTIAYSYWQFISSNTFYAGPGGVYFPERNGNCGGGLP